MEKISIIKVNNAYQDCLETKLKDLETKYMAKITQKTKPLVELGQKFERPNVIFGAHKDKSIFDEQDTVISLANGKNNVPVKIFIFPNKRIFVGNTKWALAYLKRFGDDVKVKQIPFFIVDLSREEPVVCDYKGSVYSQSNIAKSVEEAKKLNDRLQNGWRPYENRHTLGMLKKTLFEQVNKEMIYE